MANILPRDLPAAVSVADDVALIIDNGVNVQKATPIQIVDSGRPLANQAEAEAGTDPTKAMTPLTTAQAIAAQGAVQFATAAQGALADSAVQPGDLATVATTGDYDDLTNKPTLGTAAAQDVGYFATAAQGALADSAVQPSDLGDLATKDQISVPGDVSATGTPSATTYLRGDGAWATPSGAGDMERAIYDPSSTNRDIADLPWAGGAQSFTADEKAQILSNIGAAWELIEVFTPSSGTSAIERANLSAYRDIMGFGKLAPTTDDRSLILRTSTNNGSSYDSGASDYPQLNVVLATSNSYGGSTSASSAFFITLTGVGNGTNEYVDFSFTISDFNKAAVCEIKTDVTYLNASAAKFRSFSTGARAQTTARNAIQVMFAAWSTMQGGGYMVLMGRRG